MISGKNTGLKNGDYCLKGLEQIKYLLERHAILAPKKEKKILIKDTTL